MGFPAPSTNHLPGRFSREAQGGEDCFLWSNELENNKLILKTALVALILGAVSTTAGR